jgi:hypothetical protein
VLDIARELGNIGQLAALLGCPRLCRPADDGGERLVVSEQRELPPLQPKRKWRIAWKQARSSLSKAEYFTCALSSFLEKKPSGC